VKFLVDQNLSPRLATALAEHGHDAVHTFDLGLGDAPDEVVLDRARIEDRTRFRLTLTSGRSWRQHGRLGHRSSSSDGSRAGESNSSRISSLTTSTSSEGRSQRGASWSLVKAVPASAGCRFSELHNGRGRKRSRAGDCVRRRP
jgi:hypothetical protein